jgi:two-component system response regulator YesN
MKQWCTDICIKISALIKRERVDSSKMLAQNAKQYIEANYHSADLSVESLCSFLHVSPAYFSTGEWRPATVFM